MMLHELKPAEGASKAAKRKGRGAICCLIFMLVLAKSHALP